MRERNESELQKVVKITLKERADASFEDIKSPETLVHPFNKKLKIAKSWDVFPDQLLAGNKYATMVRFPCCVCLAHALFASHRWSFCVPPPQSYDVLPSSDVKSKSIVEKENRALLCGVSKRGGSETVQSSVLSVLFPSLQNDDEVPTSRRVCLYDVMYVDADVCFFWC